MALKLSAMKSILNHVDDDVRVAFRNDRQFFKDTMNAYDSYGAGKKGLSKWKFERDGFTPDHFNKAMKQDGMDAHFENIRDRSAASAAEAADAFKRSQQTRRLNGEVNSNFESNMDRFAPGGYGPQMSPAQMKDAQIRSRREAYANARAARTPEAQQGAAQEVADARGPSAASPRSAADVMTERSFKGAKSQSDWTATRAHNETVAINRDMQRALDAHKAGKMDDGLAKKLGFDGMNDPNLSEQGIRDSFNGRLNKVNPNTTTRDKMGYHKVPQTAAAVGGTAWLVNQMSQSKGQMSNSQLYGQSQPYGGGM